MMVRGWLSIAIGVTASAAVLGMTAQPALAESGASGAAAIGAAAAPLWVAPAEPPGAGVPGAEAHAGCGSLVLWSDGPAGSGTWAARPIGGGSAPVVLGTWTRPAGGLAPLTELGALPGGRYQLLIDGALVAGRVLVVDCRTAVAPVAPQRLITSPAALPMPVLATDASGSTIPPVTDEHLAAAARPAGLPGLPAPGLTTLLLAGLVLAGGLIVGARRIA